MPQSAPVWAYGSGGRRGAGGRHPVAVQKGRAMTMTTMMIISTVGTSFITRQ